jgi:hypothetical protein
VATEASHEYASCAAHDFFATGDLNFSIDAAANIIFSRMFGLRVGS